MKYRIVLLLPDGTQQSYTTDKPNYKSLDLNIVGGSIISFIVSLNQQQV